ncbi:MAG: hypothetical protein ACUVTY_04855, partial [Armatimonadota bacterium]
MNWTVSLARDFLALTARKYTRWEQFRKKFTLAAKALQKAYAPAFHAGYGRLHAAEYFTAGGLPT